MKIKALRETVEKVVTNLTSFMDKISMIVLFFMMTLTVLDVLMRKILTKSILGTPELTELSLVIMIFFSFARTEMEDGHIKVDLIIGRLSPRVQAIIDFITQTCCFVFFILLTIANFQYAESMRESGEHTLNLAIPVSPFIYVAAIGFLLMCFALFCKLLFILSKIIKL